MECKVNRKSIYIYIYIFGIMQRSMKDTDVGGGNRSYISQHTNPKLNMERLVERRDHYTLIFS